MGENTVFNLYFPSSEYIGNSASPIILTFNEYAAGRFLSFFSGSLISAVSGSYFSDVGVGAEYHSDATVFNLTFNSNAYMGLGTDISYTCHVYNFISAAIIGDYSASSIGGVSVLTIKDFAERPV